MVHLWTQIAQTLWLFMFTYICCQATLVSPFLIMFLFFVWVNCICHPSHCLGCVRQLFKKMCLEIMRPATTRSYYFIFWKVQFWDVPDRCPTAKICCDYGMQWPIYTVLYWCTLRRQESTDTFKAMHFELWAPNSLLNPQWIFWCLEESLQP